MRFDPLSIPGAWIIEEEPFADERGRFSRHFCAEEFRAHGLDARVVQCNRSENPQPFTLRGFHYQAFPHGEAKTLSCLSGSACFKVVDLRVSPSYLDVVTVRLYASERRSLHVPVGCAVAFLSLEEKTTLHYYCSAPYVPSAYRGLRYNDPVLRIQWPAEPQVISEKDRSWPDFVPAR